MSRPDRDTWAMAMAVITAQRTTCIRRAVGCVLLNKRGHVLATGNNGVAAGLPHCNEGCPCKGYDLPPGQDKCEAIHAEVNALLQCRDVYDIEAAYVTLSPCLACTKILLNTGCRAIIFMDEWHDPASQELWSKAGRVWRKFEFVEPVLK